MARAPSTIFGEAPMQRPSITALALAAPVVLALAACGDQRAPTEAPRAASPAALASREDHGPEHTGAIVAHDSCEPDSFNQALQDPEACVKHGRTTFTAFIAELQASGVARDWRFTPEQLTARLGVDLLGNNVGGEAHTFTPVRAFGGGIVGVLNQLSGNTVVAPECRSLEGDDFVPSGGKYLIESEELADVVDGSGIARVQCCIHPWMRTEVRMQGG
jgi:hypothetical protein